MSVDMTQDTSDASIQNLSASELIYDNMNNYSKYVVLSKYPNCIDGLKLGQRRALWVIKDHEHPVMENKFIGSVNEYHHHGDAAIADTVKRMMQTTEYGYELIHTDGNKGDYTSKEGGAARYLKVNMSSFTKDIFFDAGFHKKTTPMMAKEDFSGTEPMYLIPRIPTALLFPQITIGIGYKTITLPLKIENICDLVKAYSEHKQIDNLKMFDATGMEHCFLPEFPSYCYLRNTEELLEKFKNKDFNITCEVEGLMDVYPNQFTLKTIPFGMPIQSVIGSRDKGRDSLIKEALKDKNNWLSKIFSHVTDRTSDVHMAEYAIYLKRGHSALSYLDQFKQLVGLISKYTPIMNFGTPDGKLQKFNPLQLLHIWYKERYNALLGSIKYRQTECILNISIQNAILKIADHAQEVSELIRTGESDDAVISQLIKRFDLSKSQATVLLNAKIRNLGAHVKPEIMKRIEDLTRLANSHTEQLSQVHETIHNDAIYIAKKYGRARRTKLTPFIGYINVTKSKGIVQFESMDELSALLNSYHNEDGLFINTYYDTETKKQLVIKGKCIKSALTPSKQTNGDAIVELHPEMTCTVKIINGVLSAVPEVCVLNHLDTAETKAALFYTTPKFLALDLYGHLFKMSINDLSIRKTIKASGAKSDIIGIIPFISTWKEVFVIHSNDLYKNTIRIDKINLKHPKDIPLMPSGITSVMGIFPSSVVTPQVFFLPKHFSLNGFVMFENLNTLMQGKQQEVIELNNKSTRHKTMKQMYLIK